MTIIVIRRCTVTDQFLHTIVAAIITPIIRFAKTGVRMQFKDNPPNLTLREELRKIKSELREMKLEKNDSQTVSDNPSSGTILVTDWIR